MTLLFRNYLCLFLFVVVSAQAQKRSVSFIPNKNQWDNAVRFAATIPGGNMTLRQNGFRYLFSDYSAAHDHHTPVLPDNDQHESMMARHHLVDVQFMNCNDRAFLHGIGETAEYYNFFQGPDQSRWAGGIHAYNAVLYEDFYKGIDLKVYSSGEFVKYDWIVEPDADPSQIVVRYAGADEMFIDNGNLYIKTSISEIIEKKPYAWQIVDGEKIEVRCEYKLEGSKVSFIFPEGYNTCSLLVIDPLLIFSTYSGSAADNWGSSATPGEHGTLYSTGVTRQWIFKNGTLQFSGEFPATAGAFQTDYGGEYDIGILKYDSTGSQLLYASYLGGTGNETPHSLLVNAFGELILLGTTGSADFPTVNAYDNTFAGGDDVTPIGGIDYTQGSDIVMCRISADGTTMLSSTFIGDSENDGVNLGGASHPNDFSSLKGGLVRNYGDVFRGDLACDDAGNVYVATVTSSDHFPFANSFKNARSGGDTDAVVMKLNRQLSQIIWAAAVGGTASDAAFTIKLDSDLNVVVGGGTNSTDFPATSGVYQEANAGAVDGWIAKIKNDGSSILASTFTGTATFDQVYFIDLNSQDDIFAYGQTDGNFPTTPGVYSNPGSGQFVQKFGSDLNTLHFSTVFGSGSGFPDISPTAFLVSNCDKLYMTGWGGGSSSLNFWFNTTSNLPVTPDAYDGITVGNDFYFIVLDEGATEFLYATFMGGSFSFTHVDGGTSRFDKKGIVYHAVCAGCGEHSDFPTTPGAWSATNESLNCNNAAFKFDLASLRATLQTNSTKLDAPGLSFVCLPDSLVLQNLSIGGESYLWDFGDGEKLEAFDQLPVKHKYDGPGRYLVKLKAFDPGSCQGVDSAQVYINVFEQNLTVQDDDELCEGSSYQLNASGGEIYEWRLGDNTFVSSSPTPTVSPSDTTMYHVTVTDHNGCRKIDSVQISVIPKINPSFRVERTDGCFKLPGIVLTNVTDSTLAVDEYIFDFGDGSSEMQDRVRHQYEESGVYSVKLTGVRYECVYENIQQVPMYSVQTPNVITPGLNDEYNDTFIVAYGDIVDGEPIKLPADYDLDVELLVYNRWGRTVQHDSNYLSNWSGSDLEAGIYFFEVNVEGYPGCKGWVHLMK